MTSNGESIPSAGGLVVAKGSFAAMGGAERDLMRNLPAFARRFSVSVATLHPVPELESLCSGLGVPLISPNEVCLFLVGYVQEVGFRVFRRG